MRSWIQLSGWCVALAAAAPAWAVGGALEGVVLAEREDRTGKPQLLLAVPSSIGALPVDEIRLELPRATRDRLRPARLPAGWTFENRRDAAVLRGPAAATGSALAASFNLREAGVGSVGLELLGSGVGLLERAGAPKRMARLGTALSIDDLLRVPARVAPGETVEITPLDPTATPPGGEWTLDGAKLDWGGEFDSPTYRWKLDTGLKVGLQWKPKLTYTDPWEEQLVSGEPTERVTVGPPAAGRPSITGCSPKTLSGEIVCVCGTFPTEASRTALSAGGIPLGAPLAASGSVLQFRLPAELPPGPFEITGSTAAEFGSGDRATGIHLSVRGSIDRDKLMRGESTELRLWIQGSREAVPLRLRNTTPAIVTVDGGVDQVVTTSGGEPNEVRRAVRGTTPGDFQILYTLAAGSCPCSEQPAPGGAVTTASGGDTTTRTRPPCARNCDELRRAWERAEAEARAARSAANRAAEEQGRLEAEAAWLVETSAADRAQIAILRRQAAEYRQLAADARASAAKNLARDRKYPGRGWDEWARFEEQEAARRDAEAERLEAEARRLEGQAQQRSERAGILREAVAQAAVAAQAADAAESAARAARAAYEACMRLAAAECPGTITGGTTTGGTGGGTTPGTTTGGGGGDDPRDAPPPTIYGEEIDEEKPCPQRDGNHMGCVALVLDFIRETGFPGSVNEAMGAIEEMGCMVDYVAPSYVSVPPKSYQVEREIWSWSKMRFEKVKYWVNTTESREAALRRNRAQKLHVDRAIENHRSRLRAGAILGLEMIFAHGSRRHSYGCGYFGNGADWEHDMYSRVDFHRGNYQAAKGNVCIWQVADTSCYSWQSVRAVHDLANTGDTNCEGPLATNRAFHAGYEADLAQSCGHVGLIEVCNLYHVNFFLEDLEDTFQAAADRSRDPAEAFRGYAPEARDETDGIFFSFSTYADNGYEMCVPETHTSRGPYWE